MIPLVDPIEHTGNFLAEYGWYIVGAASAVFVVWQLLKPRVDAMKQAWEDAEYHKDPDKALARMEAIQRARERQQQLLLEKSEKALREAKEREERKKAEMLERLEKYGTAAGGRRLGSGEDDGYLPLSGGGASTSSYKPPKRSACSRGGCGR